MIMRYIYKYIVKQLKNLKKGNKSDNYKKKERNSAPFYFAISKIII